MFDMKNEEGNFKIIVTTIILIFAGTLHQNGNTDNSR
jgi:hypothetical protein